MWNFELISMDEESWEDKCYQRWILESSLWNWFGNKFQGDKIGVVETREEATAIVQVREDEGLT